MKQRGKEMLWIFVIFCPLGLKIKDDFENTKKVLDGHTPTKKRAGRS
jgi:hypothetical protein